MSKKSEDLIVWSGDRERLQLAARCAECGGMGRFVMSAEEYENCEHCAGLGWFGIDPKQPVKAHAGSVAKVAMLTARYATGNDLWHPHDGYDADVMHRPKLDRDELYDLPMTASEESVRRDNRKRRRRQPARLAP
jgi:hypothetical protein